MTYPHYRDFCYWLRGYIEGAGTSIDQARILECLEAAFKQDDLIQERLLKATEAARTPWVMTNHNA